VKYLWLCIFLTGCADAISLNGPLGGLKDNGGVSISIGSEIMDVFHRQPLPVCNEESIGALYYQGDGKYLECTPTLNGYRWVR
jgi:hypothetical protein